MPSIATCLATEDRSSAAADDMLAVLQQKTCHLLQHRHVSAASEDMPSAATQDMSSAASGDSSPLQLKTCLLLQQKACLMGGGQAGKATKNQVSSQTVVAVSFTLT